MFCPDCANREFDGNWRAENRPGYMTPPTGIRARCPMALPRPPSGPMRSNGTRSAAQPSGVPKSAQTSARSVRGVRPPLNFSHARTEINSGPREALLKSKGCSLGLRATKGGEADVKRELVPPAPRPPPTCPVQCSS